MAWFYEFRATKKCKCGQSHPAALDFHHLDPSKKDGNIVEMIYTNGWGKERVLKEVAKCEVLCASCHRILHWEQKQAKP